MTIKARINKIEKLTRPDNINTWQPPFIEVEKDQENSPDHLRRLAKIEAEAEAAGWTPAAGPYVIQIIMENDYDQ